MHGAGSETIHLGIQGITQLVQEILGKQDDILPPFTQGRQCQVQHTETVEEIGTKIALRHLLIQHPVCRGYHPDIHLDRLNATDSHYGAFLQESQQIDLHRQREIPYLIEKQDTVMGPLHTANVTAPGIGESALFMAKQF
ncbi:hypothetical protein D3C78_445120 [compost metagenome]